MKISINNFKSIQSLRNYELLPLTIISGINSSGKSSFIQLLLLLKQTIELNSLDKPLFLKGDFYKVNLFKDIIYDQNLGNELKISFLFHKSDFEITKDGFSALYEDFECEVSVSFKFDNNQVFVNQFKLNYILPEGMKTEQKIKFEKIKKNRYKIKTNSAGIFSQYLMEEGIQELSGDVEFKHIFPYTLSLRNKIKNDEGKETNFFEIMKTSFNFKEPIKIIESFLKNVSYIEPIREQPKDAYFINEENESVGCRGENVAQIFENNANKIIQFYKITQLTDCIKYKKVKGKFINVVKYWMCDIFNVAEDIFVEEVNENYIIKLTNKSGLTTTIKHVGFGISQLLPIVVEGLRMSASSTFIIEQPEIHLHPKLQSQLFDFIYSLILQGKKIIIETHSDHFINRMRRRIAEDGKNTIKNKINLTFIENRDGGSNIFRTIDLDNFGSFSYFPKDFVVQSTEESKAIVKAQAKKKSNNIK